MAKLRRRTLLKTGGAVALASLAAGTGPARHAAADDRPNKNPERSPATLAGALKIEPLLPDKAGILDLPKGFSYRIVQRAGERMSDGYRVPGRPDAMGCFPGPNGSLILMRNHEVFEGDNSISPYFPGQPAPPEAYDPSGTGGVTRVVLDAQTLEARSSNLVLAGTYWNCAGGLSPWGWLSCEETLSPDHGYVFLCNPDADSVRKAEPIPSYGRMRHEAATVDPKTLIAYLTEDEGDSCFYRFVPTQRQHPFVGTLQALRIVGKPGYDTGEQRPGERLPVEWVNIDEPGAMPNTIRAQGHARGAAHVRRGEGLWHAGSEVFFSATAGGPLGRGQVLRLSLGAKPTLEVIAESTDLERLDMPDNLCVSPHGLLYVAEDGLNGNFLRRISTSGSMVAFGRNAVSLSEFAGPCFSPDGRTLFVNIQLDGLTLAIRGPFERELEIERAASLSDSRDAQPDWSRGARGLGGGLAVLALAAIARRRTHRARQ